MERNAKEYPKPRIVPHDDGLILPVVGRWSKRKYHFLERYLHLFSTGMKKKWPERHYIDLFAAAGFAKIRDTNEIVASSTVRAANCVDAFTAIHACEADITRFNALKKRLSVPEMPSRLELTNGDANDCIDEIIRNVPKKNSLCITFADPYGLHLDFETVQKIAELRSDLIILLADNMDALRNWATYYVNNLESTLDRFMGEPGWRKTLAETSGDKQAEALRERYINRLKTLGYAHFGFKRVANDQGHDIYTLVYASRNEKGLEFWNKASSVDEAGQRSLFGP